MTSASFWAGRRLALTGQVAAKWPVPPQKRQRLLARRYCFSASVSFLGPFRSVEERSMRPGAVPVAVVAAGAAGLGADGVEWGT